MPKPSHREKLLTEGLRVVHERGFSNASVRDIVQAAGVPQGSFTNHFHSKEAFGLEVLNLYFARGQELVRNTLRNDSLPPLKRLRAWLDATDRNINQHEEWHGCLIGNFGIEASKHTKSIQRRIAEIFKESEQNIAYCLRAAVKAGELPRESDCDELAAFIFGALHGAVLQSKAEHSSLPMKRLKRIIFSVILR
jgi:TetR/AcrR family transcriptional regulator, transcriptional repressor for nem operon